MAEEKTTPPSYPPVNQMQPAECKSNKKYLFGLIFYAGLVTAGLITVSVLGSIYLDRLDTMCEEALEQSRYDDEVQPPNQETPKNENKKYHHKKDDNEEDIELDLERDKEIIHYRRNGNNSIAVLDFRKDLVGIYDDERDMCYLIAGIDSQLPDTKQLDELLSNPEPSEKTEQKEMSYQVDKSRLVKDLSMVPDEIQTHCWGKPVYWAQRSTDEDGTRQKRAVICRYYFISCDCCHCYYWRVCYYF